MIVKTTMTLKDLAKITGTSYKRVKRHFRWWCNKHGLEPEDFFIKHDFKGSRYLLPLSFVEEYINMVRNEKKIYIVLTKDGKPVRITE